MKIGKNDPSINKETILYRFHFISIFIILPIALFIIWRVLDVQIVNGDKWRKKIEKNLKLKQIKATRGDILSDDGSLISTSLPFYQIAFDPTIASDSIFNQNIDSLSILLSNFFSNEKSWQISSRLRKARKNNIRYVQLGNRVIKYSEKEKLKNWPLFRKGRWKGGIIFEKKDVRFKPFDSLARRVIGLIEEDSQRNFYGKTGLEYSYDDILKGKNGRAMYQRRKNFDSWQKVNTTSEIKPQNGFDIQTTLNIDMQQYAMKTLKEALISHQAAYGCVLLMEVQSGKIKAMVSLSRNTRAEYVENYNYAIGSQGVTEPGSTFKAISAMIALEEIGKKTLTDSIDTQKEYIFYENCTMRDVDYFGKITFREAFEKSSNIGISKLIDKYFKKDSKLFLNHIRKLKFDKISDFQMKGTGKPVISQVSSKNWSGCSLPWMSIGYEIKVSPLHTLTFYNAIANNAQMVMPFVVKKILKNHIAFKTFHTKIIRDKICSDWTLKMVKSLLEGTVIRGTARNIRSNMYKIAGKTGTTHKFKDGKYDQNRYYTSFAGYFPADNPRYSCIVAIDDPRGKKHFGSNVAAPVFKKIADRIYTKYIRHNFEENIPKTKIAFSSHTSVTNSNDLSMLCNELNLPYVSKDPKSWVKTKFLKDTVEQLNTLYGDLNKGVADLRGMTLKDALYILENQGLKVNIYGNGKIKKQNLRPGTSISKGLEINIYLE